VSDRVQTAFPFAIEAGATVKAPAAANEPTIGTLNARVLAIISDGQWVMPWEICERLRRAGCFVSDSSVTARLRDLRKDEFGKHAIELRKREGSRAYEYRLVK
jgi:hypothetical protein